MKAYINAAILPVSGPRIDRGALLVDGSVIKAVGSEVSFPAGTEIIDCSGKTIIPGFIDTHTHVGLWGEGEGAPSYDGNEGTNPLTPFVRAIDAINIEHSSFGDARMGGVTTVQVTPGSGNPIGGQMCVVKTAGRNLADMTLLESNGMKAALGENPKRFYGIDKKVFPSTRMGTVAAIRDALTEARIYMEKREAGDLPVDFRKEPLTAVLKGDIPLRVHAHRADDIVTAVRIGEEYGIEVQIEHGTDGAIIADFLAEKGIKVNFGPSFWHRAKIETRSVSFGSAGVLERAGVKFSLISDHPFYPIQYVSIAVALAHSEGMTREGALKAYTLWPAEMLGLADRIGSLEAGKDADFTVWDGDPYSIYSHIEQTFVNGECVYRR